MSYFRPPFNQHRNKARDTTEQRTGTPDNIRGQSNATRAMIFSLRSCRGDEADHPVTIILSLNPDFAVKESVLSGRSVVQLWLSFPLFPSGPLTGLPTHRLTVSSSDVRLSPFGIRIFPPRPVPTCSELFRPVGTQSGTSDRSPSSFVMPASFRRSAVQATQHPFNLVSSPEK
jgi:hypothetical protein